MSGKIPVTPTRLGMGEDPSTQNPDYQPTEGEKKRIKLANDRLSRFKEWRTQYDEKWLDRYKFFRGRQWTEQRPSYRHSEVINFVFSTIQSLVPIQVDTQPRWDFTAENPEDFQAAEILSKVAAFDWSRGRWLYKLIEILYDTKIYGTAYGYMGYNPDANYGEGRIDFESADPFYSYPHPGKKQINDEKMKLPFIYAEPLPVDVVKAQYPDHAEFIKPDAVDVMQGDKTDLDQVRLISPTDNKTILEGESTTKLGAKDMVLKITTYDYPDDVDESDADNPKKFYPKGRKYVICSGVEVEHGENPFDDGLIPFGKIVNYVDPRSFFGISEIEQLESPQKIFNKIFSFSLDVLTLMCNPIWILDDDSDVDPDNLFNRPGLAVEKKKGSEVRRETGVQLQPFVYQLANECERFVGKISGQTEVTAGIRPEGVSAAKAISELREASLTRIRLQNKLLDDFLHQMGTLYKNRVLQFYRTPLIVRITDDEENVTEYFKFFVDDTEEGREFVTQELKVGPEGNLIESTDVKRAIIKGDFDVSTNTGSGLPFSKLERRIIARDLFQAGAFDELDLLKEFEVPNAEQRYEQTKQRRFQQQQEQLQMQAAAAAGAVPPEAESPVPEGV
jgi:hypothetical protein